MRKLQLLLAGVLCLSVLVHAGEVITNDTGEEATGLRVTFSNPVLITEFGDILTSVDPQRLALEFVFSGGVVEPWGSHWMNWAPATASVVEYEWLTNVPAAAHSTTLPTVVSSPQAVISGNLLNPNYFAHPAYVMQGVSDREETFAMPLDGIPELGFYPLVDSELLGGIQWSATTDDSSLIGVRIEDDTLYIWGANPDASGYGSVVLAATLPSETQASVTIPVTVFESDRTLTNADGFVDYFVPWGWELDQNRILSVEAHAAMYGKTTEFLDRSINWSRYMRMEPLNDVTKSLWWSNELVTNGWWTQEAQRNLVDMILLELHEANAGMVHIVNPYFLANPTSTEFYPVYDRWATGPTMRPEEIEYFVNECHRLGMKTLVAPNICVDPDKNQGRWFEVSDLRPPSVGQLLHSYERFILPWMQDWRDLGVDFLCVGRSLDMFGEDTVQNRSVIDQKLIGLIDTVKTFFPGPVAAMGGTRHHWFGNTPYPDRAFHSLGDFVSLGVMNYFDPVVDVAEPTVEEMIAGWKTRIGEYYQPFQQRYRKPFIPFDNGSWSVDNGDQYGSYALLVGYASEEETRNPKQFTKEDANPIPQAIYYESFLSAFSEMEGYYGPAFYRIEFQSVRQAAGGLDDWTMTPRGKPAWEVMARYFGGFVASQVVVDARLDDWPDGATVVSDAEGDQARASYADIAEARFFQDPRYLYVAVSYTSDFTGNLEVKVDLDGDHNPDYLVGSDQWEEDPVIATVSRVADNYATVGFADIRVVDDVLELRIDKICIGETSVAGVQVNQIADSSRYTLMDSVAYTTLNDYIDPLSPSSLNHDYFINSACVMQGVSNRGEISGIPLSGIPELGFYPVTEPNLLPNLSWTAESSNPEGIGVEIENDTLYILGASATWSGKGEVTLTAEDTYGNQASIDIPVTVFESDRTFVNEEGVPEYYVPWDPQLDINRILSTEAHCARYEFADSSGLDRSVRFSKWRLMPELHDVEKGPFWSNSATCVGFWTDEAQRKLVTMLLEELVALGVNAIRMQTTYYVDGQYGSVVHPIYDRQDLIGPTMTDEEVSYFVGEAHRLGMMAIVVPGIWGAPLQHGGRLYDGFELVPSDTNGFWRSFEAVRGALAQLEVELGVDMSTPAYGLHFIDQRSSDQVAKMARISDSIASLRTAYPGPVTYFGGSPWEKVGSYWTSDLPFWADVDVLSIGVININEPLTTETNPSLESLTATWEKRITKDFEPFQKMYNKPVIAHENGCSSAEGAVAWGSYFEVKLGSNLHKGDIPVSLEDQRLHYASFVEAIKDVPWFFGAGFYWVNFFISDMVGSINDGSMTFRLKPAQDVVANFYGGTVDSNRVDGSVADWPEGALHLTDPVGDNRGSGDDIVAFSTYEDEEYVFFAIAYADDPLGNFRIWMDDDDDGDPDVYLSGSYNIEHRPMVTMVWNPDVRNWSNTKVLGFADMGVRKGLVELRLNKIFLPDGATGFTVWCDDQNSSWSGYDDKLEGVHTIPYLGSDQTVRAQVEPIEPELLGGLGEAREDDSLSSAPLQTSSALPSMSQAIEIRGDTAYIVDWNSGEMKCVDLGSGGISIGVEGFAFVTDIASDGNDLIIVNESGSAWTFDTATEVSTSLDLGASVNGEVLGVAHEDDTLYLLVYSPAGPSILTIQAGQSTQTPIQVANAGELISLQMRNGSLLTLDYQAGIGYRLVDTGTSYILVQAFNIIDYVPADEQASGGVRGFFLTEDTYYFTSMSQDGNPGKLHIVPVAPDPLATSLQDWDVTDFGTNSGALETVRYGEDDHGSYVAFANPSTSLNAVLQLWSNSADHDLSAANGFFLDAVSIGEATDLFVEFIHDDATYSEGAIFMNNEHDALTLAESGGLTITLDDLTCSEGTAFPWSDVDGVMLHFRPSNAEIRFYGFRTAIQSAVDKVGK